MDKFLSYNLKAMRGKFEEFEDTGLRIAPRAMTHFIKQIRVMEMQAKELELKQSREAWNRAAREEEAERVAVMEAIEQPGSNVVALCREIPFSDGGAT